MSECCKTETKSNQLCPGCKETGKEVNLLTIKALLVPDALANLDTSEIYFFCGSKDCNVVYFNPSKNTYSANDLKVPVFQKDSGEDVPVCYCFGWTRKKISNEIHDLGKSSAPESISKKVKEGKCACEINNPQGSCCLGNVASFIKKEMKL